MLVRNLVFAGALVFMIAAIAAPDAFFDVLTGHPTQMIDSECPPDHAKQGNKPCLQGPIAGSKVEGKISDAIGTFDDE